MPQKHSKSNKRRVAVCKKPGCKWKAVVPGDKYAVEHARKMHYLQAHRE